MNHYHLFDTKLGVAGIAWSDDGITRFRLPDQDRAAAERDLKTKGTPAPPPPAIAAVIAEAQRYFAGERIDFTPITLDLKQVDPFRREIYDALRKVGFGETVTYGDLAARLGGAGARAVGTANAANPVAILVPCHRVVAAGGRLGGYSGGTDVKQWLLAHEAAHGPVLRHPRRAT